MAQGTGVDALGQADHLGHARAGLRRREVGAHARADALRLADVERPALVVAEDVDPGGVGQPLGEVPLASLRGRDARGVGGELLERVDAERPDAPDQPVQDVDRGAGVGQRTVVGRGGGAEVRGEGAELAVAHLVAQQRGTGEPGRVDHDVVGERAAAAARTRP